MSHEHQHGGEHHHHHHHHHQHPDHEHEGHIHGKHGSDEEFVARNREYFEYCTPLNEMASRAKLDARFLKLRDEIIEKIFSLTPEDGVVFDPQTTKFLDYACGVGMNSEKIAPRVAYIAGMDISPKSVEAFNNANIKTASAAIARATLTDLTTDPNYESTNSAYTNFDVALCSMAFHHMPSPALAAKAIASRLKEGGTFIMVEFKASQVAWEHRDTVHKHGFTEKEIMDLYNAAGMEVTRFIDVGEVQVNEGKPPRPVFLAVGKKI